MRTFVQAALVAALVVLPTWTAVAQEKPPASSASQNLLNLNTATVDQLEKLPGIGKATAERIIEYRQKSGGFKKIEELMNVRGIGEKSFLKLKPLIVVTAKTEKSGG